MKPSILFTNFVSLDKLTLLPNCDIDCIPFISIFSQKIEEKHDLNYKDKIIVSSKNAIPYLEELPLNEHPLYVVGEKTANILKVKGFKVELWEDTSAQLAQRLDEIPQDSFVYLCGNLRKEDIPSIMKSSHHEYKEFVVYRTELTPHKIKKEYSAIVFLSPSAVKSYIQLNDFSENTLIFAIGNSTQKEIAKHTSMSVEVPSRPRMQELIQLIQKKIYV